MIMHPPYTSIVKTKSHWAIELIDCTVAKLKHCSVVPVLSSENQNHPCTFVWFKMVLGTFKKCHHALLTDLAMDFSDMDLTALLFC